MSDERTTIAIPKEIYKEFKIEAIRRDLEIRDAATEALGLWMKSKPQKRREKLQAAA